MPVPGKKRGLCLSIVLVTIPALVAHVIGANNQCSREVEMLWRAHLLIKNLDLCVTIDRKALHHQNR